MAASVREGVSSSGAPDPIQFAEAARTRYLLTLDVSVGRVRGLRRRGWKPTVRISGLDHLDEARTQGRGSVLRRMSFCSSPVVKITMWEAGIPLVHLSHESHGARSDGWVSHDLLCPLFRRTEDWYLAERAVIPRAGSPVGAMRVLLNRLSDDNAVVSIVGAVLLPVYVVWEDVGTYRVGIEPPIALDAGLDRRERLGRAADSFAERMEQAICAHPESSMLWSDLWSSSAPFDRTRSDVQ